jgi:predicted site-specific integrase-resolvase
LRIFRNPNVQVIVVEHRDRLMRFGFEYVEAALAAQGRRVVVKDGGETGLTASVKPSSLKQESALSHLGMD